MRVTHETAHRILMTGSILMFLLALVGAVGEYLGWWDLLGEVFMTVGTVGGLILGGVDLLRGASEEQVDGVSAQLGSMDDKLGTVYGKLDKLDSMDGKLDSMDGKLGTMDGKLDKLDDLDVIKNGLVAGDGRESKLDVVQTELDRQTGVLDRQVQILGEIRDRL